MKRMGAWEHGRIGAWAHGCMGGWAHGCMGALENDSVAFAPMLPRSHAPMLVVLALLGCAPAMPAVRVVGRHVELHVDLPRAEAAALAAEADEFLAAVSEHLGATPPSPRVCVFRSGWRLRLYLRRECPPFSGRTAACFEAEDGTLVVALRAAERGRPARTSLRHELAHAVIAANFASPMPWLDEGLAQVFEKGCPPVADRARIARLVGTSGLERRLVRLLGIAKHEELDEDDYRLAWGFTWFLVHNEAYGREAVRACLRPPVMGEGGLARAERCLGISAGRLAAQFAAFLKTP